MTPDYQAIFIGERLFNLKVLTLGNDGRVEFKVNGFTRESYLLSYYRWLSSPDGIDAVIKTVIESGYAICMSYHAFSKDPRWLVTFSKLESKSSYEAEGKLYSEAVLSAIVEVLTAGKQ